LHLLMRPEPEKQPPVRSHRPTACFPFCAPAPLWRPPANPERVPPYRNRLAIAKPGRTDGEPAA